jgi:hypothetical protein
MTIISCIVYSNIYASHIVGVEVNYSCLYSGPFGDSLKIELLVYRDCAGISLPASLQVTTQTGFIQGSINLPLIGCYPIPSNCGGVSTCYGGNDYGVEKCIYSGKLYFEHSTSWVIRVYFCCRNSSVTTVTNNGNNTFYIENYLNNQNGCNNSAQLINDPVNIVCIGVQDTINIGATDLDGDSLVYQLVRPMVYPGNYVSYLPPYSYNNFLNGGVILQGSNIIINPQFQEISLYAVKIFEYRNGVLVGTSIHDFQIYASPNCNCVMLPVTWGFITAEKESNCNVVHFGTFSEINSQYFILEKSFNGYEFMPVSKILACGNCDYKNEYNMFDYLPNPAGLIYYRIKQVDYDGKYSLSDVVIVENNPPKYNSLFFKWNILGQELK